MSIGTRLHTALHGKLVGKDIFGNRYYTEKKSRKGQRSKRWVMYNGMAEPSKVPPLWHAWLHYITDALPEELNMPIYEWQKEHQPNLTGTKNAYKPRGHLTRSDSKRDASVSDYEAWTPEG